MFPTIEHPLFTVTIPSTKKPIKLRPMLVREEKILLMAKETGESTSILLAVKQVLQNCIATKGVNVDMLTLYDIDYLFVHIRANSIDPTVKLMFDDPNDDDKRHEIMVDLNEVIVKFPEGISNNIALGNGKAIVLRHPVSKVYDDPIVAQATNTQELVEGLLYYCFDSYVDGDKIYKFADATREEGMAFIDSMPINAHNKVIEYFQNLPHIFYEAKYKDSTGEEQTITLNKLSQLFTF